MDIPGDLLSQLVSGRRVEVLNEKGKRVWVQPPGKGAVHWMSASEAAKINRAIESIGQAVLGADYYHVVASKSMATLGMVIQYGAAGTLAGAAGVSSAPNGLV